MKTDEDRRAEAVAATALQDAALGYARSLGWALQGRPEGPVESNAAYVALLRAARGYADALRGSSARDRYGHEDDLNSVASMLLAIDNALEAAREIRPTSIAVRRLAAAKATAERLARDSGMARHEAAQFVHYADPATVGAGLYGFMFARTLCGLPVGGLMTTGKPAQVDCPGCKEIGGA